MESGSDRVRDLFSRRQDGDAPSELRTWSVIALTGSCVGFVFGGFIGARNAGDAHIERTKLIVYDNQFQAHREMQSAAVRGFVRMGSRWGWRIGIFASLFSATNILLGVYRDKDDFVNTTAAGAITGGAFRLSWGLKASLGGMIIGTVVTLPCALAYQLLDRMLVSSFERQMQHNEKKEARQRRRLEKEKLSQRVDVLLQAMDTELSLEENSDAQTAPGLTDYYEQKQLENEENAKILPDESADRTEHLHSSRDCASGKIFKNDVIVLKNE